MSILIQRIFVIIIILLGFKVHMTEYKPQANNTELEKTRGLRNLRIFAVIILIVFSFGFYISYKYGAKGTKAYYLKSIKREAS